MTASTHNEVYFSGLAAFFGIALIILLLLRRPSSKKLEGKIIPLPLRQIKPKKYVPPGRVKYIPPFDYMEETAPVMIYPTLEMMGWNVVRSYVVEIFELGSAHVEQVASNGKSKATDRAHQRWGMGRSTIARTRTIWINPDNNTCVEP